MSSPENVRTVSPTQTSINEVNEHESSQPEADTQGTEKDKDQVNEELVIKRKRPKTLAVWNDFDKVEIIGGAKKALCKYFKEKFATRGRGSSTSHLRRHGEHCMQRKLHMAIEKKQSVISFQPSNPDSDNNSFSALEWRRNNNLKYKILSKLAADVRAIPISTIASESTFSAGGRVIDEYRSKLNEKSIEALICGGDWLRHKYNLKRKSKVDGGRGDHLEDMMHF